MPIWHYRSPKDKGSEVRLIWVQLLTPLALPVARGKSFSISKLILFFVKWENYACLVGLLGKLDWVMQVEASTVPGTKGLSVNARDCYYWWWWWWWGTFWYCFHSSSP